VPFRTSLAGLAALVTVAATGGCSTPAEAILVVLVTTLLPDPAGGASAGVEHPPVAATVTIAASPARRVRMGTSRR
jgi:hypothetical protein